MHISAWNNELGRIYLSYKSEFGHHGKVDVIVIEAVLGVILIVESDSYSK